MDLSPEFRAQFQRLMHSVKQNVMNNMCQSLSREIDAQTDAFFGLFTTELNKHNATSGQSLPNKINSGAILLFDQGNQDHLNNLNLNNIISTFNVHFSHSSGPAPLSGDQLLQGQSLLQGHGLLQDQSLLPYFDQQNVLLVNDVIHQTQIDELNASTTLNQQRTIEEPVDHQNLNHHLPEYQCADDCDCSKCIKNDDPTVNDNNDTELTMEPVAKKRKGRGGGVVVTAKKSNSKKATESKNPKKRSSTRGKRKRRTSEDSEDKQLKFFKQISVSCWADDNCNETFQTLSELNNHLTQNHNILRFRCLAPRCNKTYQLRGQLGDHLATDHSLTEWNCSKCGSRMNSYAGLRFHIFQVSLG